MPQTKKKSESHTRKTDRKRKAESRLTVYREKEKIADKEQRRLNNQDSEYREKILAEKSSSISTKRKNPEYREKEKQLDKERHRQASGDPDYRERVLARQSTSNAARRKHPEYRVKEKAANKLRNREALEDPDYREKLLVQQSISNDARRQDPEYREKERAVDTPRRRKSRQHEDVRTREKQLRKLNRDNTKKPISRKLFSPVKRKIQSDDDITIPKASKLESIKSDSILSFSPRLQNFATISCLDKINKEQLPAPNMLCKKEILLSKTKPQLAMLGEAPCEDVNVYTSFMAKKQLQHTRTNDNANVIDVQTTNEKEHSDCHNIANVQNEFPEFANQTTGNEKDPQHLLSLSENLEKSVRTIKAIIPSKFSIGKEYRVLLSEYFKSIRLSPKHVCSSCGGLFYKTAVSKAKVSKIPEDLVEKVLCVQQTPHQFCVTCKNSVLRNKVPRLCLSNGFTFPQIPDSLKDLSALESRLVALRIPFMQIKLLGAERQSILKGNVVNVENDLDVCTSVIPRSFDNTSTIQVQLMRRLTDKTPYMHETIRPAKVYAAAKYLMGTDLYRAENVVLSRNWENSTEEEITDFICNDDEQDTEQLQSEITENAESTMDTFLDFMGAEECLVIPQNSNLGIRIAPGQGKYPIPLFADTKAEELSFPTVYCGVSRQFSPELRITYTDIAKSEIRRYDRRACMPTKLLYSFKKSFNEKLRSAVQVHLRKRVNKTKLKAKDVRTHENVQKMIRTDESYSSIWGNLRSSPAYWSRKQKFVMAMLRQLGKCHFFITLSAAESKWNELLVTLSAFVNQKEISEEEASKLSKEEKRKLIRADPVTCMRHFDHKHRHLINKLLIPKNGVFAERGVSDYFTRLEFQMRGSPHSHGLYWIKDAPEFIEGDAESEQRVIKFIDEFVTCKRSKEESMQEVLRYQIHKHSSTCYKKCKQGKICRFGYPKPPLPITCILYPLPKTHPREKRKKAAELFHRIQADLTSRGRDPKEKNIMDYCCYLKELNVTEKAYIEALRSSVERTTVFLKRSIDEAFINAYNPSILQTWGANMDIQFVLDTYACAKYCVGYILKSDGGMSKLMKAAAASIRNGNHSLQQKIQKYAGIVVNSSEVSAQEAAAYLLGIANTRSSRSDVFINTAQQQDRTTILRPQEELNALEDEDENICVKGLLDHYVNRPKTLESKCLAYFAAFWQYSKSSKKASTHEIDTDENLEIEENFQENRIPTGKVLELLDKSGFIHQRRKSKVIRFVHYGKQQDPFNYWREQILLFLPWRDEDEFSGDPLKIAQDNIKEIVDNSLPFYYNREIDETILGELLQELRSTEEENDSIEVDKNFLEEDEQYLADVFIEEQDVSKKIEAFLPPKQLSDEDYYKLMRSLNDLQRRFVLNCLHLVKTSTEPFYHFLSGGAGVGKSHVINAIVQSVTRYHCKQAGRDPSKIAVIVAAPTGMAAYNVSGMTIHTAFRILPVQNNESIGQMSDSLRNSLHSMMQEVELIIIDEISMVVLKMFFEVNSRLQEIFDVGTDFANKSMIVVGHLRQLPPIGGKRVFESYTTPQYSGNHLWPKFRLFELTEIMRQRGQFEFCRALNNMSEGTMDDDDIRLIKECTISDSNQPPEDAIWLFKTNKHCQEYNRKYFEKLEEEGVVSDAVDSLEGSGTSFQKDMFLETGKSLTHMQSDGLPSSTYLKVGAKYFISTNIKVSDGLFNGTHGTLKAIECTDDGQPKIAWMDFTDQKNGVEMRKEMSKLYCDRPWIDNLWTPIRRMRRKLSYKQKGNNLRIVRIQIPLVACNGMTVAKSQGSSLPSVVVNVRYERGTERLKPEELYVGCSRATSREGLFINGDFVPPSPYKPDHPVTIEMDRLRKLGFPMKLLFLQDIHEPECVRIYFHNVQSFNLHKADVMSDSCALSADILCFVEPHTLKGDNVSIPGFNLCFRKDAKGSRHESNGVLVYLKESFASREMLLGVSVLDFIGENGCDIVIFKVLSFTYILIYRSPSSSAVIFSATLDKMLKKVEGDFVIFGDININLSSDVQEGAAKKFLKTMKDHNAISLMDIQEYSTDGKSHIDVAFSNAKNIRSWYYESYYSYHKPICSIIKKV